ncbi:hypothetical protein Purlil1_8684 [Purpureocillium lilacinum]|uniref:Proline utilization protein PrnX n=1 Tax=Purpureocillium lilacinum TaxID=33203 RepID=A0ABR0BSE7_PURLI|nr:hypothetical protein Purlil1_8684 [Purpureocillium lilacinum]
MENIQYLTNDAIHSLLINLTKNEAINFRATIEQALEDFSVGGERQYQPEPSGILRPNGQKTLFRPFTSDTSVGAKLVVEPPPGPGGRKEPLHGILILMDGQGNPTGVLAAEEVTGYRTSMNVMVPFSWRKHVNKIVIFGAGVQALWHTRLMLTLRGSEIDTITYVSPRRDQVKALIERVSKENKPRSGSDCSFHFIDSTAVDFHEHIEARLGETDCVFCTTPSTTPLFPASYLTKRTNDDRQPLVSAIGSWQPHMIELDPSLLRHCIDAKGGYNPVTGEAKGVVLVDDRNYALENSGEVIKSEIMAEDMVELGQIIALRKGRMQPPDEEHAEQADRFISEGFVVYKSIGVSLTDLAAGNAIIELIQSKQGGIDISS